MSDETRKSSKGTNVNTILLGFLMMLTAGGGTLAYGVFQKTSETAEAVAAIKQQVSGLSQAQSAAWRDFMPRSEIEASLAGIKADLVRTATENNEFRLRLTQLEISIARIAK
jgi:hypothetical protein